jgi:hypothetical protein
MYYQDRCFFFWHRLGYLYMQLTVVADMGNIFHVSFPISMERLVDLADIK